MINFQKPLRVILYKLVKFNILYNNSNIKFQNNSRINIEIFRRWKSYMRKQTLAIRNQANTRQMYDLLS